MKKRLEIAAALSTCFFLFSFSSLKSSDSSSEFENNSPLIRAAPSQSPFIELSKGEQVSRASSSNSFLLRPNEVLLIPNEIWLFLLQDREVTSKLIQVCSFFQRLLLSQPKHSKDFLFNAQGLEEFISHPQGWPQPHMKVLNKLLHEKKQGIFFKCLALQSITKLEVSHNDLMAFNFQNAPNLTALDVSYNQINNQGLNTVGRSTRLADLNLSYNKLSYGFSAPFTLLKSITSLNLSHNKISELDVLFIISSQPLKILNLTHCKIPFKNLRDWPPKDTLETLLLGGNHSKGNSWHYLSDKFPNVTTLNLDGHSSSANGLSFLSGFKYLANLSLRSSKVQLNQIHRLKLPTSLQTLDVSGNPLGSQFISKLTHLENLKALSLGRMKLDDRGLKNISSLKNLESLNVRNNHITSQGLSLLRVFTSLTSLNLKGNQIEISGLEMLKRLTTLKHLNLEENSFKVRDRDEIQRILPHLQKLLLSNPH